MPKDTSYSHLQAIQNQENREWIEKIISQELNQKSFEERVVSIFSAKFKSIEDEREASKYRSLKSWIGINLSALIFQMIGGSALLYFAYCTGIK